MAKWLEYSSTTTSTTSADGWNVDFVFNRDGVLLLRRLDSRLSKDLPSDLQKLRCKAAFEALKFSPRVMEIWKKLAERMWSCLTGLSSKYDEIARLEGIKRPELLTAKSTLTPNERKLAGLCPLNAKEVRRLVTIDYIVCKESDVFMASHGGNMGCAIQGHRAYEGHKKLITPNKRQMLPYFLNKTMTETESEKMMKKFHSQSLGQREIRASNAGRDVTKYLVPEWEHEVSMASMDLLNWKTDMLAVTDVGEN
ncbi:hypothetical protein Bca4012_079588 [Brassica carinata]